MKHITLITDGACSGNPGPGGWAFIARYGNRFIERSGHAAQTTNNRMELQAVIEGLSAIKEPCEVTLISDSRFVLNGLQKWRFKWKLMGWTRNKSDRATRTKVLLNADLWQQLDTLCNRHVMTYEWVKGHSGHIDNERCDVLATTESHNAVTAHQATAPATSNSINNDPTCSL